MKTISNTTCWLGLILACGVLTYAVSTQAVKPPKPPPEPPPSAAYDHVLLGGSGLSCSASRINESGWVIGSAYFSQADLYGRPFLVVPEQENGTAVWYKDVDQDGRNDLMADLGIPLSEQQETYALALNDDGLILGSCFCPPTVWDLPWIIAPQVIDGQLSWADLDTDEINRLMTPLPVHTTLREERIVTVKSLNNQGEVVLTINSNGSESGEVWQRGFLLVPNRYEVSADGAVTIGYPAADLNEDGLNDYLINLGSALGGDGINRPLLPTVINDRGDIAGTIGSSIPFVLRPRFDESLGWVWNEDNVREVALKHTRTHS